MRRLTEKDIQGNWRLKDVPWERLHVGQTITEELWQKLYGALWKLMEYEDTGLSPDDVEEVNKFEGSNGQKYLLEIAKHRWIQVSERLPEPLTLVLVTVHTSEWIADYDSNWVPDEEKTYHPEEYNIRIAYKIPEGNWIFYDETGSEVCCENEIGSEKGVCYSVVTAWQPLPEPYKGV